jgi:hypothetical protein
MKRPALALVLVLLAGAPAHADRLVEAITRHDTGDIGLLRSKLPDDSVRCALGVAYIFLDDLTRAALYLEGCAAARISPGVAGWVALAVPALERRLRMSELAPIEVTTQPAGLLVTIDTVRDEVFPAASAIWLPAGDHTLRAGEATVAVTVRARVPGAAHVALDPAQSEPRLDPRVLVMRANDCTLHRLRHGETTCELPQPHDYDDDGLLIVRAPRGPLALLRHDPLKRILQSVEEL